MSKQVGDQSIKTRLGSEKEDGAEQNELGKSHIIFLSQHLLHTRTCTSQQVA